jgi:hypothetical protein
VTTETLWCVHVQGADEFHACESREAADLLAAQLAEHDRGAAERHGANAAFLRPLVTSWPFDAASHADELAGAND